MESTRNDQDYPEGSLQESMLDPDEADEEVPEDGDTHMDSDDEEGNAFTEEIQLQNDSIAHFDLHKDSIFCVAQHPVHPSIVATGGGDDSGFIFQYEASEKATPTAANAERQGLKQIFKLEGHSDSINALTFSLPDGAYLLSAGLDGRLRAYYDAGEPTTGRTWTFLAETQEVDEINFVIPCPNPAQPNVVALGASDGSVWIYSVDATDLASPLTILQAFYLHTGPCTAGAWTPDGKLLATVSEDGSFYVWDVFGDAAAAGLSATQTSQAVVGLTAEDERFRVEGGLYCVAVHPTGAFASVGGAEGHVRIVGLPRLPLTDAGAAAGGAKSGAGARNKSGGGKQAGGPKNTSSGAPSAGQAGQILASLQAQVDSIETIAFSAPPLTLMATGSVDGSIVIFDTAHQFTIRRHIKAAHEEEAVIKVEYVPDANKAWLLTSCGNDGVLKRWDTRGGAAATSQGLVGEWRGHRGGGEGGGILDFVQAPGGQTVVTAGDDGVALVFGVER